MFRYSYMSLLVSGILFTYSLAYNAGIVRLGIKTMSFSILSPAHCLGLLVAGALLVSSANAQETRYVSKNASRCEMFAALSDVLPADCMVDKKVVVYDDDRPTPTAVMPTRVTAQTAKPSSGKRRGSAQRAMATPIQFAFNSADLTPQARRQC